LTLPQSELRNLAVNDLSIAMFTGVPRTVPVTVVLLVPLKCSVSGNWKSMCPLDDILWPIHALSKAMPWAVCVLLVTLHCVPRCV